MLTGEMQKYEEPLFSYNNSSYNMIPASNKSWTEMYKDLATEVDVAKSLGFEKGVKVNLKSKGNKDIGVVSGFAVTIKDGFDDFGEINPIGVLWGHSKYEIFYNVNELEIVE